jgi:3-oxoacyl-[acyl-carrier-protein] synthase-3
MSAGTPRILGLGYEVPATVRGNDAPIFDWLKAHAQPGRDLFEGYVERRVLAEGEDLMTLMVPAACKAMRAAGLGPLEVDLLLGCGSVSAYLDPNDLCRLHHELGLPERAWVLPLNNEFSNFNAGLLLADGLIRAQRVRNALVAVGGNWTRYVDYHTPEAVSAADGAGAAVLGLAGADDASRWEIVDYQTVTQSGYFGTMFMQGDRCTNADGDTLWGPPHFHITADGITGFKEFGEKVVPTAALTLMARHGLEGADVALISHQASRVLLQVWAEAIRPAQVVETIAQFANMTVANIPVTLAWSLDHHRVTKAHLILLGIGVEMHANALLLRRSA